MSSPVRFIYPITTPLLVAIALRGILVEHVGAVRQNMIDAEYEIEERVENYQPDEKKTVKGDGAITTLEGHANDDQGNEEDWSDEDDALRDSDVMGSD